REKDLVVEFFDIHKQPPRSAIQGPRVWWTKLLEDFYKANFDAALFDNSNIAGIGVVIKDCNGNIIGALKHAEVLAASRAMAFARKLSLFKKIAYGS
ncbi:hypothetical protein CFP56_039363, partial [Quercus suber]